MKFFYVNERNYLILKIKKNCIIRIITLLFIVKYYLNQYIFINKLILYFNYFTFIKINLKLLFFYISFYYLYF